ncbi:MAG: hypothetical protein GX259_01675 [Bacteroidales bacterium]|nr:hypothetical protein [Bacteroidales bacterium]
MNVDEFFPSFLKELDKNPNLCPYYRLNVENGAEKKFCKAYFLQRFIDKNIEKLKQSTIFLSMAAPLNFILKK